jgi:AcrR family transcriptional regulator
MTTTQRARSASDKQERRAHILSTALALWEEHTFTSFTMAQVAARSGLAKGTLYLYFATKEELLLALLEGELDAWFAGLDAGLGEAGAWDAERAAALICGALEGRPALVRLLPIAASILEHNIPAATARAYKEGLLAHLARSAPRLEARLTFLTPGDGAWVLQQVYALIVGLGQMADPAPTVRHVLDEEAMAPLRVDFAPAFRRAVATLMRGLAASQASATR